MPERWREARCPWLARMMAWSSFCDAQVRGATGAGMAVEAGPAQSEDVRLVKCLRGRTRAAS
jgi:hypothetical protein